MGIFGTAFGIMGGAARGAASATMWTGNAIYTGIQNARTNKEIKALHQHAADANYQNRAVALLTGANKQQLLLTSGEPGDDDVYDFQADNAGAALDYIWGDSDDPDGVIISGGQNDERVCAVIPFIHKAQSKGIPVFVLHTGNQALENVILNHSVACEFISRKGVYYDAFRGMPVDDVAFLLYETMQKNKQDRVPPAAESLLHALIEVVLREQGSVNLANLAAFPIMRLKSKLDGMKNAGEFTADEYDEVNHYYMAGSAETDSVRVFLQRLNRQAESVYGKPGPRQSNIKRILNLKGVVGIEVGLNSSDWLLALAANHLSLLQSQGKEYALVVDGIAIAKCPELRDLLHGHPYAVIHQDFISSLSGGEVNGDELFKELTGSVATTVLFRHTSGTSCQKWSEQLGKYRKIRIRYNISQSNAYMNSNNSRGISVDETDEPRIRAETLEKLPERYACIHSMEGILIAEVRDI